MNLAAELAADGFGPRADGLGGTAHRKDHAPPPLDLLGRQNSQPVARNADSGQELNGQIRARRIVKVDDELKRRLGAEDRSRANLGNFHDHKRCLGVWLFGEGDDRGMRSAGANDP